MSALRLKLKTGWRNRSRVGPITVQATIGEAKIYGQGRSGTAMQGQPSASGLWAQTLGRRNSKQFGLWEHRRIFVGAIEEKGTVEENGEL